jgi:hypothetical protein
MSRHDEHGRVEEIERDYGPEWWAMGREVCACEHHYDVHGSEGHCQIEGCPCPGWAEPDSAINA